uniref:Multidrug efflux MFS transporter EmrD n=1 Tax=Candidatus Aschnera chinzeii TaxID=1485666 RepID=A0AAT9G430_9ENTR|nr:MAG: multidrug efflux MFS transporter EmrD [Candidatus Aschnera chinzeii]
MKKISNYFNLLMLIALISVGQMTQTIYIPAIPDIAFYFKQPSTLIQSVMGSYLLCYGFSQLLYGPLSDYIGRRPVILIGLIINLIATIFAFCAFSLNQLIIASAIQGFGIGVAGVMARTMPRDLYSGIKLRKANSILNMGIILSPLLAPIIGGIIIHYFTWRAIYIFLLLLSFFVFIFIWIWLPETKPSYYKIENIFISYITLLTNKKFIAYLIILISGLSGIVIYESISGILLSDILGLNHIDVSIQFILPIPAAFLGAWYSAKNKKSFSSLMWFAILCCITASIAMWLPSWFHMMNTWTLIIPASLFFFGAGILFPLATSGAMEPFPFMAGSAGALIGGLQNIGSGFMAWLSALISHDGQFNLGLLMLIVSSIILLFWFQIFYGNRK